ncbi:hypothetical protein ScPMuIL_005040 [Solemya velum]
MMMEKAKLDIEERRKGAPVPHGENDDVRDGPSPGCGCTLIFDRNGRRIYAAELAKYIEVDIYGACGTLRCPREKKEKCFDMLNKHYKFYLAFENSSCRDYITEKFFINGLGHDVIPIVMGAAPEDYRRVAPSPHSYIHVDEFESPKALAEYLHKLDKNDDLYNEYFNWKGTFSLIHTANFYCRLCPCCMK